MTRLLKHQSLLGFEAQVIRFTLLFHNVRTSVLYNGPSELTDSLFEPVQVELLKDSSSKLFK